MENYRNCQTLKRFLYQHYQQLEPDELKARLSQIDTLTKDCQRLQKKDQLNFCRWITSFPEPKDYYLLSRCLLDKQSHHLAYPYNFRRTEGKVVVDGEAARVSFLLSMERGQDDEVEVTTVCPWTN